VSSRRIRSRGPAAVLLTLALFGALAACSGDQPGDTPLPDVSDALEGLPTAPDPCPLITTDEATAAFGSPAGACESDGDQFVQLARIRAVEDGRGQIDLTISVGGQAEFDQLRSEAEAANDEFRELDLGDAAFVHSPFSIEVVVLKGDLVLSVRLGGSAFLPDEAATISLATTATGRLTPA
jgi:hypothetical protein